MWFYPVPEEAEQEVAAEITKESNGPAVTLGAWDITVNKIDQNPCPQRADHLAKGERQ